MFTFAAVIELRRKMREREKSDGGAAGADEDERKLAAQEDMQLDILKKVTPSITSHHSHHTIHITPFASHHSHHTYHLTTCHLTHSTQSAAPPCSLAIHFEVAVNGPGCWALKAIQARPAAAAEVGERGAFLWRMGGVEGQGLSVICNAGEKGTGSGSAA